MLYSRETARLIRKLQRCKKWKAQDKGDNGTGEADRRLKNALVCSYGRGCRHGWHGLRLPVTMHGRMIVVHATGEPPFAQTALPFGALSCPTRNEIQARKAILTRMAGMDVRVKTARGAEVKHTAKTC